MTKNLTTWIEIDTKALLFNIDLIKKNLPKNTKFTAVIKANAYGHGTLEVANTIKNSCDYLAVFDFNDAVFLRKKGIKTPLFVLGPTLPEQFSLAVKNNIEITISSLEILEKALKFSKKLTAQICVDTGMGRDGFVLKEMEKVIKLLQKKSKLEVKGLYAHFAAADEKAFDNYTKKQFETLTKWQMSFAELGLDPIIHHSASAGSLKKIGLDMARSGCAVYGLWPSLEMRDDLEKRVKLKPVLSWKVQIPEIKNMKKGSCISYGCTHTLKRDSKLAILPIGYYDGIPRSSSGKSWFLVKGKKVPQIGRVTMNMVVLDITDVAGVKTGDIATVIGHDGKNTITAEDWGTWASTINYEITTRLNSNLPRIIK